MFDLGEEIARVWAGAGDEKAMIESFRKSVLLVPHLGDGYVVAGDCGDVRWLYGFTTPAELAAWVVARGGDGDVEHGYVTVRGSRLLDVAVRKWGCLPVSRSMRPDRGRCCCHQCGESCRMTLRSTPIAGMGNEVA